MFISSLFFLILIVAGCSKDHPTQSAIGSLHNHNTIHLDLDGWKNKYSAKISAISELDTIRTNESYTSCPDDTLDISGSWTRYFGGWIFYVDLETHTTIISSVKDSLSLTLDPIEHNKYDFVRTLYFHEYEEIHYKENSSWKSISASEYEDSTGFALPEVPDDFPPIWMQKGKVEVRFSEISDIWKSNFVFTYLLQMPIGESRERSFVFDIETRRIDNYLLISLDEYFGTHFLDEYNLLPEFVRM